MKLVFDSVAADLRYAVRGLATSRGYTAVALLSLSLGIGATTAIFSIIWGALIFPYPYVDSYGIWAPEAKNGVHDYTVQEFLDLQKIPAFASVMATLPQAMVLSGEYSPQVINGTLVSASAFDFLGVEPELGRTILPVDVDASGQAHRVVVLSYAFWQRIFDQDPAVIGKVLTLNREPYTVVGVMPPRFTWYGLGVWLPLGFGANDTREVDTLVRLAPGVTREVAEAQLHVMHQQWEQIRPGSLPRGFRTVLTSYMEMTIGSGDTAPNLIFLFGAVCLLLCIACANVANLQLARNAIRAREMVVRVAIGAARGRLIRQLLTESLVLSLTGGILGIGFAAGLTRLIVALMPPSYIPLEARITVNVYVLLFSFGVSVLTGTLFGVGPALRSSRPNVLQALNAGTRGFATNFVGKQTRTRLVILEVALAVLLLMSSVLTARSFVNLHTVDLGFQPERVFMLPINLNTDRYPTASQGDTLFQQVLEHLPTVPGVESAAIGNGVPFGGWAVNFSTDSSEFSSGRWMAMGMISADYASTIGTRLLRGRMLTDIEINRKEPVALINESASRFWPEGQDPVGRVLYLDTRGEAPVPSVTVVGILDDTKNDSVREPTRPMVFIGYPSLPQASRLLMVRTRGEPTTLAAAIREQILAIDPALPIGRGFTFEQVIAEQMIQPRFNMALFAVFAFIALSLTMLGLYSVISYHVARRTHEIGIRVAVGAKSGDVLSLILGAGMRLVVLGAAIGIGISFMVYLAARSQVYEFTAFDTVSVLSVVGVITATALLACYIPARRASRLDPMVALRLE